MNKASPADERDQSGHLLKVVGRHSYVHVDSFDLLPPEILATILNAECLAQISSDSDYNVARIDKLPDAISLLNYPGFFDDPFPSLKESWHVEPVAGRVRYRSYRESLNPPVLHRKELLLRSDHPRRETFESVTKAAEAIGLFKDPTRIGFREQWLRLIREHGYQVIGHEFVPIANDDSTELPDEQLANGLVARHRTALTRSGFSAPIQALARSGLISASTDVFDYGCGRGDDLRGLLENGIEAAGWDPYYFPTTGLRPADVVNIGFVINVIEDFHERVEALRGAFAITKRVLAVATMIATQIGPRGRPHRDGFITTRNTFQKYYTQSELAGFIADVLDEEPVPVSPGVFFVFRDKSLEQSFLSERHRNSTVLRRLECSNAVNVRPVRADRDQERSTAMRVRPVRADRDQLTYEAHRESIDALWQTWVRLGREPDASEVKQLELLIEAFGSLRRALQFTRRIKDQAILLQSREARIADLLVYLALGQFSKRRSYTELEAGLQRDIRSLFGSYQGAQVHARQELLRIANTGEIAAACSKAASEGLGWLVDGESLQLHTGLVERLPVVLRIYVACGSILYGDVHSADLVKIHIKSGKLTLMRFDDFENKVLPRMTERIKLNLSSQRIDFFLYDVVEDRPYLFWKSRYINEECAFYAEQIRFDERLDELHLFDLSGYGPQARDFREVLERNRWEIEGFELKRCARVPALDDPCGRYLTYRQLIECGETQKKTSMPNLPRESATYSALQELAENVLDPVIEYFGSIKLTFGFCSPELGRAITARIAPKLDQHAAHERTRTGRYVCQRVGAACDFIVEHENMREVVDWMAENVKFDRIYFYGADRPIHVSFAPNPKVKIVHMVRTGNGKLIPRVLSTSGG